MVKRYNKIYAKKNGDLYVDTPLGRVTMGIFPDRITVFIKTSGHEPMIKWSLLEAMFEELKYPTELDEDDEY